MTMAAGNKKLPCNKTPFQCQPWNESRYPPRTSGNTGWPMQKGCTRATCLTGYSYELVNRCARHMWPQSSGYGFDPARGPTRLHFVGRVEQFQHDWARLLTRLGDREHTAFNRLKIRHVNYRPVVHELAPSTQQPWPASAGAQPAGSEVARSGPRVWVWRSLLGAWY